MTNIKRIFKVDGQPFFPIGGQTHNSSGYSAAEMEMAWKALETVHANSFAVPVYWEQVEPKEGHFDFSAIDSIIDSARQRGYYMTILWFATWKNGKSRYCPVWVKQDTERFRRIITPDGQPLAILSSHCEATRQADERAFCRLMAYLRAKDEATGTVIAVQIENEPGFFGSDRDYGELGETAYRQAVPSALLEAMRQHPESAITRAWAAQGALASGDWEATFGWHGSEYLCAWSIANYVDSIAAAGQAIYDVPMYVNVWLGYGGFRTPGSYPSGGAVAPVLDLWKWRAPHIAFIAPDIYVPHVRGYTESCRDYARDDNPLYIPESGRSGPNALNMFYALANYDAIGLHVFGIDSIYDAEGNLRSESVPVVESLRCVAAATPLLLRYQGSGKVHAVVQEEYQSEQLLDLGAYYGLVRFDSTFTGRIWRDKLHGRWGETGSSERGRGLVFQAGENEFYAVGTGFRLLLKKKMAPANMLSAWTVHEGALTRLSCYAALEEGHLDGQDNWIVDRRRSGDEADHGVWLAADVGVVHIVMID